MINLTKNKDSLVIENFRNLKFLSIFRNAETNEFGNTFVPYPMKAQVIQWLNDNKIKFTNHCPNISGKDFFDLNDRGILTERDGIDQFDLIKKLCENDYGMLSLNVGFGKTVLIVHLVQHFIGKGKILICTNNNAVRDEIQVRLDKSGCKTNYKLINPIGFMNSNKGKACLNGESKELDDVDIVLIDECDSANTSLLKVLSLCKNKSVVYGFSGTSDRFSGENLTTYKCIKKINDEVLNIISHVGFSVHYKMSEKILKVNIVTTNEIPDEQFPDWYDNYKEQEFNLKLAASYDNVFNCDVMYSFIQMILENKKDVAYVPVKKIEYGQNIYNYFKRSKYKILLWHSGSFECNDKELNKKIQSLKELKLYHDQLDLVIASSVSYKGVDCPKLSDIGILYGTQSGVAVQMTGRVFRHPTPTVWLLESENNNTVYYNISHKARLKKLLKSYKTNVEYKTL